MNKVLVLIALGLSATSLGVVLFRSPEPAPTPSRVESGAGADELQELQFRVQLLEENNRDLSTRLLNVQRHLMQEGKAAPTPTGAPPPAGLEQQVAELRQEVRGMMVGEVMHSDQGRTVLRDMVREVQTELFNEQRAQRQQQFERAQAQAAVERQERVQRFITEARLTYAQEQELKRRLEAEESKRQALFSGGPGQIPNWREAMQTMRTQRQETDQAMNALLDEGQRAQYEQMRREDFGGGGRGRGGGGRGP